MQHHPQYHKLREKWVRRHRELETNFWERHKGALNSFINDAKRLLAGSISGLMLLTTPVIAAFPQITDAQTSIVRHINPTLFLLSDLKKTIPQTVRPLTPEEETQIGHMLSNHFRMKISPQLQGIRLNRSYGLIGQEQHLYRYPGDSLDEHFDTPEDASLYRPTGIAPGLGAWGYFANSKEAFTQTDMLREKYYIAVQTFLAPGFNENVKKYGDFFRYREMLVVNPENGKAIVADIADAGPSEWTGKSLGGSPEVMHYLERVDGTQKGPVLYFFIDDPHHTIPLGPIQPKI